MAYDQLFQPINIGPVSLRNKIMSTAHVTNFSVDGYPNERHAYYLTEKAKGGIGLIIMEAVRVHPTSLPAKACAGYDDRCVPYFKVVTDMVHQHGAKIFMQILHMGRQTVTAESRLPLWAPSPLPCPNKKEIPHAMTKEEIQEVIKGFADSAKNAQKAGFDGVEIHAAHGYLPQQFMSPLSNIRTDEYGGSLENRLRFTFEVISAVREAVGSNFAVGIRLSGDEFTDGGVTLEDMQGISSQLAETGKLDFLDISQCNYTGVSFSTMIPDMHFPFAPFVYLAAGIKQVVTNIPVFTVARIVDPAQANQIVADHQADVVGMTRATLCDPELPNKAKEGRDDEIRNCVGCNQGCVGRMHKGFDISCLQNPTVGKEKELGMYSLTKAEQSKKVLVIGGGPGGMEAARVAALRGHRVTLFEEQPELGGQIRLAANILCRQELEGVTRFLGKELTRLKVDVRLNSTATAENIVREKPDVVIAAAGSVPVMPDYGGNGEIQVLSPNDVALGIETGDNILVYDDDGHYRATSIAEHLAGQDKRVEIITPRTMEGAEIIAISWLTQHQRLRNLGVNITTGAKISSVDGKTATIEDVYSGEQWEISGIDTIVASGLRQVVDDLFHSVKDKVAEIYTVGDCVAPRYAMDAIREGHMVGRKI